MWQGPIRYLVFLGYFLQNHLILRASWLIGTCNITTVRLHHAAAFPEWNLPPNQGPPNEISRQLSSVTNLHPTDSHALHSLTPSHTRTHSEFCLYSYFGWCFLSSWPKILRVSYFCVQIFRELVIILLQRQSFWYSCLFPKIPEIVRIRAFSHTIAQIYEFVLDFKNILQCTKIDGNIDKNSKIYKFSPKI